MNIRKERTHQCGLTNLDFKTKGDYDNLDYAKPSLKYADFGTMDKTGYKRINTSEDPLNRLGVSGGWKQPNQPDPKYDTAKEFYQTQGKRFRAKFETAHRKEGELEKPTWTDKIFTGDSAKLTAYLSKQARDRDN